MTTAQVVETSVTVNSNSPIQDYVWFTLTIKLNLLMKWLMGSNLSHHLFIYFGVNLGDELLMRMP